MSEQRVSDERLAAALVPGETNDALLVHGARHVALDLRDARAEIAWLRVNTVPLTAYNEVVALHNTLRAHVERLSHACQYALSEIVRESDDDDPLVVQLRDALAGTPAPAEVPASGTRFYFPDAGVVAVTPPVGAWVEVGPPVRRPILTPAQSHEQRQDTYTPSAESAALLARAERAQREQDDADRLALVERAVSAGANAAQDESQAHLFCMVVARVIAEHDAEQGGK